MSNIIFITFLFCVLGISSGRTEHVPYLTAEDFALAKDVNDTYLVEKNQRFKVGGPISAPFQGVKNGTRVSQERQISLS